VPKEDLLNSSSAEITMDSTFGERPPTLADGGHCFRPPVLNVRDLDSQLQHHVARRSWGLYATVGTAFVMAQLVASPAAAIKLL